MGIKKSGFTLIELLVVITIIGILSSVSIATFKSYSKKAEVAALIRESSSNFHKIKSRCASEESTLDCINEFPFNTTTKNIIVLEVTPNIDGSAITPNTFRLFGTSDSRGNYIYSIRTYGNTQYGFASKNNYGAVISLNKNDFLANQTYEVVFLFDEEGNNLRVKIYIDKEQKYNELLLNKGIEHSNVSFTPGEWDNLTFPGNVKIIGLFAE